MAVTNVTIPKTFALKAPAVAVYVREKWADEWDLRADLWCSELEFAASPTMPSALLVWDYGTGSQPGSDGRPVAVFPVDLVGWYVKIVVDEDADPKCGCNTIPPWYGRVMEVQDAREGGVAPAGRQVLVCWGMEAELDAAPILASWIEGRPGDPIGRAIGFNCGPSHPPHVAKKPTPNRAKEPEADGLFAFATSLDPDDCDFWRPCDIVDYLLGHFTPRNPAGNAAPVPWEREQDRDRPKELLSKERKLECDGRTVRSALDQLFDRRRGMGWYVKVDENQNPARCQVYTFTYADADLDFPTGDTEGLAANPNQFQIDTELSTRVDGLSIRRSDVALYDQVIVRGEPIRAVLTVDAMAGDGHGAIVRDWTDADATAYNLGASTAADYPTDISERQMRNLEFRANTDGPTGERLQRVFAWFKLDPGWDGGVWDWDANEKSTWSGIQLNACEADLEPDTDRQGDLHHAALLLHLATFWRPGLRLERHLPLYEHEDYSGDRIKDGDVKDRGDRQRFFPPLVFLEVQAAGEATPARYQLVDKLSAPSGVESVDALDYNWACNVQMRDDEAGFVCGVSGMPQHKLAKNDFVPLPEASEESYTRGSLDWQTLVATVCIPLDDRACAKVPLDSAVATDPALVGKRIRRLAVHVPDAHIDYVVPGTIVGVKDGQFVTSSGGVLRSDLPRLYGIARFGAQWYCTPRQTITLTYAGIRRIVAVGDLVLKLDSGVREEEIKTVVTRVRYDLHNGRTIVQTGFAELDLQAM